MNHGALSQKPVTACVVTRITWRKGNGDKPCNCLMSRRGQCWPQSPSGVWNQAAPGMVCVAGLSPGCQCAGLLLSSVEWKILPARGGGREGQWLSGGSVMWFGALYQTRPRKPESICSPKHSSVRYDVMRPVSPPRARGEVPCAPWQGRDPRVTLQLSLGPQNVFSCPVIALGGD